MLQLVKYICTLFYDSHLFKLSLADAVAIEDDPLWLLLAVVFVKLDQTLLHHLRQVDNNLLRPTCALGVGLGPNACAVLTGKRVQTRHHGCDGRNAFPEPRMCDVSAEEDDVRVAEPLHGVVDPPEFGVYFHGDVGANLRFGLLYKLLLDALRRHAQDVVAEVFHFGVDLC